MKKIRILKNVIFGRAVYKKDTVVEVNAATAKAMIEAGHAEPAKEEKKDTPAK